MDCGEVDKGTITIAKRFFDITTKGTKNTKIFNLLDKTIVGD